LNFRETVLEWNWNSICHKLKIHLVNKELIQEGLALKKVEEVVKEIVSSEGKQLGEIGIIFERDEDLLKINKNFLQHNYFTDVITFDYNRKNKIMGDILISIDTVRRNAVKYNQDFMTEIIRVIIHGVLHLSGYEDKSDKDKQTVRAMEELYLCRYKELSDE